MSVLLIWEEVPENTVLYVIPNEVAEEYREFLEMAHGKMINADEMNKGMEFLNVAISGEDCGKADAWAKQYVGCLKQYKVDHTKPVTAEIISLVYLLGFML